MADVYEKDFEEKAQPDLTDFLRLIGGDDDAAYKVLVSDIAKAIIEQYTGSTIAGEEQSLQTALNAIDAGIGNTAMGTTATTVTGAIAEHTDLIGDDSMGTTATTLTGAIGEHSELIGDDSMGTTATTLTGAIAEHSELIGDDTMGTTATTLTGAIAEHEQELGDLNSNITTINNKNIVKKDVANNLTTSSDGYVLDARQGKILNDNPAVFWGEWTRSGISHATGNNYWTITGKTFPPKTGYSRRVVDVIMNDRNVICNYTEINDSNQVVVYTRNFSSSTVSNLGITVIVAYFRDTYKL